MRIKRIRKLKVNSFTFDIKWDNSLRCNNGSFSYTMRDIIIGTKNFNMNEMFGTICHELFEIVTLEMNVRYARPDVDTDYIFMFDHRQHETMMNMFASLISQFIE